MTDRETRTLSITPEHAAFLSTCVESGRYQSTSDAVRAALRLLEDAESRRSAALVRVRAMIADGVAELERGEVVDGRDVFRRLSEKHDALRKTTN